MPQMRSFGSFAGTPNLGANFTGGYNASTELTGDFEQAKLAREKMAMEAQQHAQSMAVASAKLQQEAAMQKQELQAKQQMFEQETMRKGQELAQEAAYRDQMIGLKQSELGQQDEINKMKIKEAADEFEATQKYQKDLAHGVLFDERDEDKAALSAALANPRAFGASHTVNSLTRSRGGYPGMGTESLDANVAEDVTDATGNVIGKSVVTGPRSRRFIPSPATLPPGAEDAYFQFGNRALPKRPTHDLVRIEKEYDTLSKDLQSDKMGRTSYDQWKANPEKVGKATKAIAIGYEQRLKNLQELKSKLGGEAGGPVEQAIEAPPGAQDGDKVKRIVDGKEVKGVVKGGRVVLEK